jgi:23S rRNA pseudouridine2605 synthase
MYANLTKKNVERGKWRYLGEKEIRALKYMNKQKNISGAGNNKKIANPDSNNFQD